MAMTYSEAYDPAMYIETQEAADRYLEWLVTEHMKTHADEKREEVLVTQRTNLAYWAAYFNNETRERVERLFRCAHPFFGAFAENGPPAPEHAFKLGQFFGDLTKNESSLLDAAYSVIFGDWPDAMRDRLKEHWRNRYEKIKREARVWP